MDMHDIDAKSGKPVVNVLQRKHPAKQIPMKLDLKEYGYPPPLPTLDISQEVVERVAYIMGEKEDQKVSMPPNYNFC